MLIGIIGFKGSGKDSVGKILAREFNFHSDSFAKSVKDVVSTIFGYPREMLEGDTEQSRIWREKIDPFWSEVMGKPVSPRDILNLMGTDICQSHIHRNVWIYSVDRRIIDYDDVVITDVRFEQEIDYIKDSGGYLIRVRRGPEPPWFDTLSTLRGIDRIEYMSQFDIHRAEWDWIGREVDYTIDNDGTKEDLCYKVRGLIEVLDN